MKSLLHLIILMTCSLCWTSYAAEEARNWTDSQGNAIVGVYVNSTDDSVTIKRSTDGQAFRLKLVDCKPEEKEYVAKMKADAREADSFDAIVTGEISWRLPPWNSLSWSNNQPSELWIWDEKLQEPSEKIATILVSYTNSGKRNEFFGKYKSDGPLHLWRSAKYVIKGRFSGTVNGEQKNMEQTSVPMVLPSLSKGGINLTTVRFSLAR